MAAAGADSDPAAAVSTCAHWFVAPPPPPGSWLRFFLPPSFAPSLAAPRCLGGCTCVSGVGDADGLVGSDLGFLDREEGNLRGGGRSCRRRIA
jgi:hypothetical protein